MSQAQVQNTPQPDLPDRGNQLVTFVAGAKDRTYPDDVIEAARMAFMDYLGVTVGSMRDAAPTAVARMVKGWRTPGNSTVFSLFRTSPAFAALVNGTAAHSQDYDDTHAGGAGHPSAVVWSTAFALGEALGRDEASVIRAFVTGYEVMAKLGGGGPLGVGRTMQRKGFHPTSVMGRAGATAAACVLYNLNAEQTASAFGVAGTTAAGLIGSFGSHSKPFHAGIASMDGIIAAELAQHGFLAATSLYELEGGLLSAIIQDGSASVPALDGLGQDWEIRRNGFKLFASCRATHAAVETAMRLRGSLAGQDVEKVHVRTGRQALVTAGKTTFKAGLDCKFSVAFCVAMALRGYRLLPEDFTDALLDDTPTHDLFKKVEIEPRDDFPPGQCTIDVTLAYGDTLSETTGVMRGHPDNPLNWQELETKFLSMTDPCLGASTSGKLLTLAKHIDRPGSIKELSELLARSSAD